MVRKSIMGVAALGLLLVVVGCATMQKGESIVKYTKGEPVRMAEAPSDGTYGLYSGTALRNPDVRFALKAGDKLGFEERDGKVIAVAGDNETEVQTGTITKSYFWRKVD